MKKISYLSMSLAIVAVFTPAVAQAQDGTRLVMRRPLQVEAVNEGVEGVNPTTEVCGGPSNPCSDTCNFFAPRWVITGNGNNECIGDTAAANAVCRAFLTREQTGILTTVPDSVCLEDAATYNARCNG